jgi:hypothetical protein
MPRVIQSTPERREKIAVALKDLERLLPETRQKLLVNLNLKGIVKINCGTKEDVAALEFKCKLLTAAMIADHIRCEDAAVGDELTSFFLFREKAWSKISNELWADKNGQLHPVVVLTVMVKGKCHLNPEVFPDVVSIASLPTIQLKPERVL